MNIRTRHSPTRRTMQLSTIDGGCYCVMMGLGESNLILFALAIGLGEVLSGLVGSVPLLSGAILQLITPAMVNRLGSHKKWIVISAIAQALTFAPLAVGGFLGTMHPVLVFATITLYWATCMGAGAPWNTFISGVVPGSLRARYFTKRSRVLNLCLITATLCSGFIIDSLSRAGESKRGELLAFGMLFTAALLARMASGTLIALQTERTPMPDGHRHVPTSELITRFSRGSGGKVLIYMLSVQFAVQIFTPFLNPYLYESLDLRRDFTMLAVITAMQLVGKVLALPLVGMIAHRHGPLAAVRLGGLAIVPLPLLWMAGDSMAWLIVVQLISGAAFATYELGTFLLLFEAVPDGERTSVMVRFVLLTHVATVLGSFAGAAALTAMSEAAATGAGHGQAAYFTVFAASALARLATLALLARVRQPDDLPTSPASATLQIHPAPGTLDEPLLPSISTEQPRIRDAQRDAD